MGTRFATIRAGGWQVCGVVAEAGVIARSALFPQRRTLKDVIAAGALGELAAADEGRAVTHPHGVLTWDLPVPNTEKIICVGVNFPDRNAEYKDGQAAAPHMSLFIRFARSFVGHRAPLLRPREMPQLDYEGEIAVVLGRGGRSAAEGEALAHVAALTLCNEGTLHDWVRHAEFNVTQRKNWHASGAIGPWLVALEDPAQLADERLQTRVNGEVRQDECTGRMLFSVARQIA